MALAGADWSSLPCDLVRRIADSFLASNDVDCYVDLRAVCHNWRSATDDPSDASDPRFRPCRWIILDDDKALESDTRRLLVNTASGRFLHRELPLLRHYYVVATTLNGFFVLADKSPPHAARVFNPLTGANDPFRGARAARRGGRCCPEHYVAFSDFECFTSREYNNSSYHAPYNFARRAIRDGFDGALPGLTGLSEVVDHIGDLMRLHHVQPANFFSNHPPETGHADDGRCFLVQFSGQLLIVVMASLLDGIGDVKTCESEVLESTAETTIAGGIRKRLALLRQLGAGVDGRGDRLAVEHFGVLKKLEGVLLLAKEESRLVGGDIDTQEMVKGTEIGHGKFFLE
uniref:DUF295 domain-containing protein n=1 Tax=Aegilops tauschii TaxID=37682 RepID=R7W669_AEGTA